MTRPIALQESQDYIVCPIVQHPLAQPQFTSIPISIWDRPGLVLELCRDRPGLLPRTDILIRSIRNAVALLPATARLVNIMWIRCKASIGADAGSLIGTS